MELASEPKFERVVPLESLRDPIPVKGRPVLIGMITRLQIQRSSLKIQGDSNRYFDPEPITSVPRLDLDPGGVVGIDEDGEHLIDVHHRDHPMSKNRNLNGISIGFLPHYEQMRQRVGAHLLDGLAGENLLIDTSAAFTDGDLPTHLILETADGRRIDLVDVQVAEPCVEFTKFCLHYPPEQKPDRSVTETLDFLRRGMRGYYATYEGAPTRISVGDRLLTG